MPTPSLAPQRLSEAMTSLVVTGEPSWNFRPSRRVKVDQHAVDAGDGLGGPDRINDAHIGVHYGAQDLFLSLRMGRERNDQRQRAGKNTLQHVIVSLGSPHRVCKAPCAIVQHDARIDVRQ